MNPRSRTRFAISAVVLAMLACNQVTGMIVPAAAPTPTPVTTGGLRGTLVEGTLSDNLAASDRPPLSNVLILLCAEYAAGSCTTNPQLATYTDEGGSFEFPQLQPGNYAVLYNPFLIDDGQAYLDHFDGRQIDLSTVSNMASSMVDGQTTIAINGGPKGGVDVTFDDEGNLQFGAANADTAIYTSDFTLIAEFVENGTPVIASVEIGRTAQVTVSTHATLNMGEDILLEPAGERITLPALEVGQSSAQPAQDSPSEGVSTEAPEELQAGSGFHEKFDDNRNGWNLIDETASWGHVTTEIEDGLLKAHGIMDSSMFYTFQPGLPAQGDAEVSVEVRNAGGAPERTRYGLYVFGLDEYQYVCFEITDQGLFTVMSAYDSDYQFYALDEPSDAIRRGTFNTLTARIEGKHAVFSINGTQVFETDLTIPPDEGMVGIYVDWIDESGEDQVIEFDNFKVSTP